MRRHSSPARARVGVRTMAVTNGLPLEDVRDFGEPCRRPLIRASIMKTSPRAPDQA